MQPVRHLGNRWPGRVLIRWRSLQDSRTHVSLYRW